MKMVIVALAIGVPAPADGIRVTPGEARPGQRVHITVPDCAVGPTPHTAVSDAFTGRVTLHGKADTGEADPVIKNGLAPGTYPIKAFCEERTVLGRVAVAGERKAAPPHRSSVPYWALGAVLAGGAALLIVRRRRP